MSSPTKSRVIVHITPNSFRHSSRIIKECVAASRVYHDAQIRVIALWEAGTETEETTAEGISVWRVPLSSRRWPSNLLIQPVKYLEWVFRIVVRLRRENVMLIHAHSVASLPVGAILKWFTRAPLVYDAHELESARNGISPLRNRLAGLTERIWIRAVDATMTVCDSIADWYRDAYGVERPAVVRNIPAKLPTPAPGSRILRQAHGIPDGELLFIYQGALATGRGIEELLEIFSDPGISSHVVFMGFGAMQAAIVDAASRRPNIHFQPAVPPHEVLRYTSSADIGLCLIENTCLSYYYSLPNKLFEYLLCGLPVVVNDLPEQSRLVETYECGWVVPLSPEARNATIASIDRDGLAVRRRGAERAATELDWNEEAARMTESYKDVCARRQ